MPEATKTFGGGFADRYGGEVAEIYSATRVRLRRGHVKLADCPVFPAEAANALSTDRGLGWRLARQAGPVLRHPAATGMFANFVFAVGREEVLANLDDARLDRARASPESDLQAHQQLFAPKSAHDVAAQFRPTAAALIDPLVEAGGGDAVADVTTPMADALFDGVSRLQLLPVEHLNGRSGHLVRGVPQPVQTRRLAHIRVGTQPRIVRCASTSA